MAKSIFGEKLIFGEPPTKPKGYYATKARIFIEQLIEAIQRGTCTTNMAKIPTNPTTSKEEKMKMYNALKSFKRRKKYPVDVAIIEDDLWLIYEGNPRKTV